MPSLEPHFTIQSLSSLNTVPEIYTLCLQNTQNLECAQIVTIKNKIAAGVVAAAAASAM